MTDLKPRDPKLYSREDLEAGILVVLGNDAPDEHDDKPRIWFDTESLIRALDKHLGITPHYMWRNRDPLYDKVGRIARAMAAGNVLVMRTNAEIGRQHGRRTLVFATPDRAAQWDVFSNDQARLASGRQEQFEALEQAAYDSFGINGMRFTQTPLSAKVQMDLVDFDRLMRAAGVVVEV